MQQSKRPLTLIYLYRKLFGVHDKHQQHPHESACHSVHSQRRSDERHEARGFQRLRLSFQADQGRGEDQTVDTAVDELKQPESIT